MSSGNDPKMADLRVKPAKYTIKWHIAHPKQQPERRSRPSIGVIGTVSGRIDGEEIKPAEGHVILQFWDNDAEKVSWKPEGEHYLFHFDYPAYHYEPLRKIIEGGIPFSIQFKLEDHVQHGIVQTDFQDFGIDQ